VRAIADVPICRGFGRSWRRTILRLADHRCRTRSW
jgi:hypothetical protein